LGGAAASNIKKSERLLQESDFNTEKGLSLEKMKELG